MTDTAVIGLATLGAALLAYMGNWYLFRRFGQGAAVTAVPWWEEACKVAAIALAPGTPVLVVHLLFGLLECAYDVARARSDRIFLGVLSLSVHGLVGGVASLVAARFDGFWWAYVIAGLLHTFYNLAVLHLVFPTLGADAYAGPEER